MWGVVVVHAFCNWMGLPRVWGRVGGVEVEGGTIGGPVRGKEDEDRNDAKNKSLGIGWTVAYYVILIVGAFTWCKSLWVLTESEGALMKF